VEQGDGPLKDKALAHGESLENFIQLLLKQPKLHVLLEVIVLILLDQKLVVQLTFIVLKDLSCPLCNLFNSYFSHQYS
jgi:hypothetical protein